MLPPVPGLGAERGSSQEALWKSRVLRDGGDHGALCLGLLPSLPSSLPSHLSTVLCSRGVRG